MKNNKVYIIGAGPIGLVTAWKLLERGIDVEIFEKNSLVGGMCRTWKWNGFLLDTGPHIFHTPNKSLSKFWEKEFKGLFVKKNFWCKNVKEENPRIYWDYPVSLESINKYPTELKNKIKKELKKIDSNKKLKSSSFFDYMQNEVGPTLAEMFYTKYPEKIWGINTKIITPEWAPKRVELRKKDTPFYYQQWNAVAKRGTGTIYENIKSKILKLGGKIHLNHNLENIDYKGSSVTSLKFKNKKIKIYPDDTIVSSLPITMTARFFNIKTSLKFRGIRTIYLAFKKKKFYQKIFTGCILETNILFSID